MKLLESPAEIAAALAGRKLIDAEFMYKPRPPEGRARIVFDYALRSRLSALRSEDAVLFICNSPETAASFSDFEAQYPHVLMLATIANATPLSLEKAHGCAPVQTPNTPHVLNWESPDSWQQYAMTDRWARIDTALHIASLIDSSGYIIMPAHDAVWGRDLLKRLARFSEKQARGGLPAAVSPYTYHQHSPVPDAEIPQDVIDLLNTAFGRDSLLGWKMRADRVQAFWGKMGMIPFAMCATVRQQAEKTIWEDDLEIDRVIREAGYGVRSMWMSNPAVYRQALPVFDRDGVRQVIERTLHYSLNIPSQTIGESSLNFPLGPLGKIRRIVRPKFAKYNALAEDLIAECNAKISARLKQYGASWVDWGAYRHLMRVGDPAVEVWKRT
jgi:hypothetical protein